MIFPVTEIYEYRATKLCATCAIDYPATLEYFHRSSHATDGWNRHCKSCCRIRHIECRRHDKEQMRGRT